MLPSIELRIQNLIKALSQVVLPAIDPENELAREQAQLVIAHLQLIALQWDKAYSFERIALRAMQNLAAALCNTASGGPRTSAATAALRRALEERAMADPRTATAAAQAITALGGAVDEMILAISTDADATTRTETQAIILDYAKHQAHRERVWFAANNLDPDRGKLEAIDTMLAQAALE